MAPVCNRCAFHHVFKWVVEIVSPHRAPCRAHLISTRRPRPSFLAPSGAASIQTRQRIIASRDNRYVRSKQRFNGLPRQRRRRRACSRVSDKGVFRVAIVALRHSTMRRDRPCLSRRYPPGGKAASKVSRRLGDTVVAATHAASPAQPANPMNLFLAPSRFPEFKSGGRYPSACGRACRSKPSGLSRIRTDNTQVFSLLLYLLSYQQRCFLRSRHAEHEPTRLSPSVRAAGAASFVP